MALAIPQGLGARVLEDYTMNKMIAGVVAVGMMVFAGVATAADVKGAITAVNAQARTVTDRKSTRLNSSHSQQSRMPSSA